MKSMYVWGTFISNEDTTWSGCDLLVDNQIENLMMAGVLRGLFTDMAPEVAMKYDIKKAIIR